jgi:alkanesulfonate monooxygenase SsuD/methylene tetrahydromethanopterin reductase-like flavin-dependent oxidoreductase (luciferase family)
VELGVPMIRAANTGWSGCIDATGRWLSSVRDGTGRELFAEGIEIIDQAWTHETLTYEGRYRKVSNLPILPRPVQQPRPPIWIGAGPAPDSYQFAAAHGYNLMMAAVFSPVSQFVPLVQVYRAGLRAAGHDPEQVEISIGNHCYVGASSTQAKAVWEKHYLRYLRFFSTLLDTRAYEQSAQFQAFAKLKTFLDNINFDNARATLAVCGDAEECAERVAQAKEAVGNTHYWVYTDLGGLPREEVWASLRRFAEKVIPKFR